MKIILTQEKLANALNIVSHISSTKTTLPILSNLLIRAEDSQLQLNASNLEIFITNSITAKVDKEGVICIPANLITEFINNLPKTNINIETKDEKLIIKAGNYKSIINTINPDEFPSNPKDEFNNEITIDSEVFKNATSQVITCTSSDTSRPILTGVYLYNNNGELLLTATDGYRLAEKKVLKTDKDINIIIPTTTISEINRIIGDEKEININISDEQIKFKIGDVELISRLIDGNYINYSSLIPSDTENSAVLNKADFIQAVKVAELFARESAESIIIKTNSADQCLEINSIKSEFGDNNSKIDGDIVGDASITLNARYLLNAINSIEGDTINFSFLNKMSPALITGKKEDYKHIIMPVRS
jgi:DNA polymerase III, beta subunit